MTCRQEVISLRYDPGLEVRIYVQCFIMSENDHAGFGSGWFFYVFDSGIIYRNVFGAAAFAVPCCDGCCLKELFF